LGPRIEIAIKEMNRGRSLTVTARTLRLSKADLQRVLRKRRLLRRKGKRWVFKDNRPRRVPVMTVGRIRVVTVPTYKEAQLVGEHAHGVREFVSSNNVKFLKPFKGRSVQAVNGREFPLETDPNALHRIAAMDSPPFHEIYEITSNS
jgi:hypothetical protein